MEDPRASRSSVGENRDFWGPGDRYTFLVTGEESGGSMFALDCVVGAGGGPPPHRHLAEDELFYARMIAVYTPSGMEGWFREVCMPVTDVTASPPPVTPEPIERMLEAGPRHNVEWVAGSDVLAACMAALVAVNALLLTVFHQLQA